MDTEKTLSPQESLDIIANAIAKTKENIRENSFGFLLWGWLITIASFVFFILLNYTSFEYFFIPFPILAFLGIITTIIYFRRRNIRSTITYSSSFINKLWIVLAVSFILVVFINVMQGQFPFTYTLIIAGIGTLVTGWTMNFRPLMIGGIIFLASAVASIYIEDNYKPLLHGLAFIVGYLIPGYLLSKSKS
ncbi:MAG: hypothetical protein C5B59_03435 [Bacteroidetes bacterium]|nr:MAG: hypothetical protein C5B59_03435 [Bacteroidota bacterium]